MPIGKLSPSERQQLDDLTEAVRAYISEFDNPVADFGYRKMLRDRLRSLVGAPPQKMPRLSD